MSPKDIQIIQNEKLSYNECNDSIIIISNEETQHSHQSIIKDLIVILILLEEKNSCMLVVQKRNKQKAMKEINSTSCYKMYDRIEQYHNNKKYIYIKIMLKVKDTQILRENP